MGYSPMGRKESDTTEWLSTGKVVSGQFTYDIIELLGILVNLSSLQSLC